MIDDGDIVLSGRARREVADRLVSAGIDRKTRGKEKASDHTPVWCEIDDA